MDIYIKKNKRKKNLTIHEEMIDEFANMLAPKSGASAINKDNFEHLDSLTYLKIIVFSPQFAYRLLISQPEIHPWIRRIVDKYETFDIIEIGYRFNLGYDDQTDIEINDQNISIKTFDKIAERLETAIQNAPFDMQDDALTIMKFILGLLLMSSSNNEKINKKREIIENDYKEITTEIEQKFKIIGSINKSTRQRIATCKEIGTLFSNMPNQDNRNVRQKAEAELKDKIMKYDTLNDNTTTITCNQLVTEIMETFTSKKHANDEELSGHFTPALMLGIFFLNVLPPLKSGYHVLENPFEDEDAPKYLPTEPHAFCIMLTEPMLKRKIEYEFETDSFSYTSEHIEREIKRKKIKYKDTYIPYVKGITLASTQRRAKIEGNQQNSSHLREFNIFLDNYYTTLEMAMKVSGIDFELLKQANVEFDDFKLINALVASFKKNTQTLTQLNQTDDELDIYLKHIFADALTMLHFARNYKKTNDALITLRAETNANEASIKEERQQHVSILAQIKEKADTLEKKLNYEQERFKDASNDIARLNSTQAKLETLEKMYAKKEKENTELQEKVDFYESRDAAILRSEEDEVNRAALSSDEREAAISLLDNRKTVIIGGNINWVQNIQNLLPNANVTSTDALSHDLNMVTYADILILNVSSMNHSMYHRVKKALKRRETEISYLIYINGYATNMDRTLTLISNELNK